MTYLLSKNYEDKQPVFLQDPYIDGTPQVGNTLTVRWFVPGYDAADNDWSVAYQWYWGAEDTTLTEEEFDETGQALVVTADHLQGYLACRVAVTNPSGTVVKISANVGPVVDYSAPSGSNVPAPTFATQPAIVGTPQVGRALTVEFAVPEVSGVIYSYAYTWYRDSDGVDGGSPPAPEEVIAGAGSRSYSLISADEGKHIKCRVTVTNLAGAAAETTNYTAQIQPADDTIPSGATVIDAGWLASTTNGGPDGPWLLRGNGKYFYLTTDVTMAGKRAAFYIANRDITLDLNGHTITYDSGTGPVGYDVQSTVSPEKVGSTNASIIDMGNVGICMYLSWVNTEIAISGATEPTGVVIKNGTIIGTGSGTLGHGIWGHRSYDLTLRNMRVESGAGRDAHAVCFVNGSNVSFTDSIFVGNSRSTRNRNAYPSVLYCGNGSRPYVARCAVIGSNAGISCGSNSLIEDNVISQSCWHTNGWGVISYQVTGVTVRNNVIIPLAGRGIYFDSSSSGNVATGNVVLAWEHPNVEYPASSSEGPKLNASCFKQRYGGQANQFYGNSCLAVGGVYDGQEYGINGVFGTSPNGYRNTTASCIDVLEYGNNLLGNHFFNNTLRSVLYGTPISNREVAGPIAAEGAGPSYPNGGNSEIYQNDCYSNDVMIVASWDDGIGRMRTIWDENSFTWQDGPTSYSQFVADADAKIAALGLTDEVAAAVASRWNAVKSKLSPLINSAHGALQSRRSFWFYDYYAEQNEEGVLQITNSTFGESVDPLTRTRYGSATRVAPYSLKSGRTAQVRIMFGGSPVANATALVSPVGFDSPVVLEMDDITTVTDANGYCTITFWDTALTRTAGVAGALAQNAITSSTITVDSVGSATFSHASVPAEITLT